MTNEWNDPMPRCPRCELPWVTEDIPDITDEMVDLAGKAFANTRGSWETAMRAALTAALTPERKAITLTEATIVWVLGEELPQGFDQAEITCHAGDVVSIKSLMDTLMMTILARGGFMRHHGITTWDTTYGPAIHVFLAEQFSHSCDHQIAVRRMTRDGQRYGMTMTVYTERS